MQSLNRKALLAFLFFLVLDLLVRLWASRGLAGPEGVETLSKDPEQVSALEIQAGKERLLLERTPQGFKWVGARKGVPTMAPLTSTQAQAVDAFLKRICSMIRESVDELADVKESAYGLDTEQEVSIRLQWHQTTQTQQPFVVRFGTSLPLNVMYVYAVCTDKPGLFKVLRTYKESAVSLLQSLSQ